jgi:hypothetical protein
MLKNNLKKPKGMIALTTVLFVSTILMLAGLTLVITGVDFALTSKANYNGSLAQIRSRSCLEESLYKIKNNLAYTGNFSIAYPDGNCSATVTNDALLNIKNVALTGTVGSYNFSQSRKVNTSTIPFGLSN